MRPIYYEELFGFIDKMIKGNHEEWRKLDEMRESLLRRDDEKIKNTYQELKEMRANLDREIEIYIQGLQLGE